MNTEMQKFKTRYLDQLRQLGVQVEQIAEQLKNHGNEAGSNKLYQLGNELEHFFDEWNHFDQFGKRDQTTGLSENSHSVVDPDQESQ